MKFSSKCAIQIFANSGPRLEPIATPSFWTYTFPLNTNVLSLTHSSIRRLRTSSGRAGLIDGSGPLYSRSKQTSIVLESGFYRRYVDDTFCLFKDRISAEMFFIFLNTIDTNIKFEMEWEQDNKLEFLDTVVIRSSTSDCPDIRTKVKATDKGLFYHFNSFVPMKYKLNLEQKFALGCTLVKYFFAF